MIKVQDLIYEYPSGQRALHGVSFDIEPGQITALVGPNGAGKTTLLRCLAALTEPLAGRVEVAGHDVFADPRAHHERLGYLSDFFGLYPALTVQQTFLHAAASRGLQNGLDAHAADTAQQLGLTEHFLKPVSGLSRGLRQRTGIGVAIIHRPQVLILDEPASGLDPEARIGLSGLLRELNESGMSILVSSHILSELEDYSTEIMILRDGRLVSHERTANAHQAGGGLPLELRLSAPAPGLAAWLASRPGLSDLRPEGPLDEATTFTLSLQGGPEAQQALLADLVRAGAPLLALSAQRVDFNESYLRTMKS